MLVPHVFHVEVIDRSELNRWLVAWEHRMGPYTRPSFAIEAHHALFMHGEPVAVTGAGDTRRETVGNTRLGRFETVELARLCASGPEWCQPMLRIWRQGLFPAIARAHGRQFAVSYQDRRIHTGGIYRFDGWARIGTGGGGGTDQRTGTAGRLLSVWAWPPAVADVVAERREVRKARAA